jgi:TolA protein
MDYRIEQLRYLLREDPSSRIFFQLGELLRREGDPTEAVEILKKGLERHPRYVAAWVALGRAHRDSKALDEAMSAFEIALEIDRENPVAARLLGETAAEREDWLGAVKALKLTRALAGGDEELDAKITQVEAFLEEDGRLEQPAPAAPPEIAKPERCLEVVSLSADDPFAPDADETEDWGPASDVFEVVEVPADEAAVQDDGLTEAETEAEAGTETGTEAGTETGTETAAEAEAGFGTEAGTDSESESDTWIEHPFVDEGSVGAWSAMKAAGVSGDEAWVEPTDEIVIGDEASAVDESWVDPAAEITAAEPSDADSDVAEEASVSAEPEDGGDESTDAEVTVEAAEDEEPDESPDSDDVEETPPVELQDFDPIEVTHPDVMEQRLIEAEVAEKAEEEARLQAEAEAAAKAEAEAAAKAEEEARLQAEAEAAAKAETEAAAKAEEEARLQAEAEAAAKAEAEAVAKAEEEARLLAEAEAAAKAEAEAAAKAEEEARLLAEAEAAAKADSDGVPDQRHKLSHGVPLPTMTLAKLALEQDDRPLAMATLESLIERDPTNAEAAELLGELRAQAAAVVNHHLRAMQATTKIAALQGWLDAVRLAAERRVQ